MSRNTLTAIFIAVGTIALMAGIVVPPYLSARAEKARTADLTERATPTLEALITAEGAYKEREGKFWRDKEQVISAEGAKQALNVDISPATGLRFAIAPPDLVADPTLRLEAQGTGENEGFIIACVYDSISKTKGCKQR